VVHLFPFPNLELLNVELLNCLSEWRASNSPVQTVNYVHGGDVGSTGVGSQSGMPGFCCPVKQTDLQFKRRQFRIRPSCLIAVSVLPVFSRGVG
jgi:hypothetical protein